MKKVERQQDYKHDVFVGRFLVGNRHIPLNSINKENFSEVKYVV